MPPLLLQIRHLEGWKKIRMCLRLLSDTQHPRNRNPRAPVPDLQVRQMTYFLVKMYFIVPEV